MEDPLTPGVELFATESISAQAAYGLGASQREFWVSPVALADPSGHRGSQTNPFLSVEEAQIAIRDRISKKRSKGNIAVNLMAGVYPIHEPLAFTQLDGGRFNSRVIWRDDPNDSGQAVLSGFRDVTNWQQVESPGLVSLELSGKQLWKADLNGFELANRPEFKLRQLYINGERGTMAESQPTAMPEDLFPTYPFGFRPVIGQFSLTDGTPVNGIVYSNPVESIELGMNGLDWADPTTWDRVEGLSDPRRQQDVEAVTRMQWREFRMPVDSIGSFSASQQISIDGQDVPVGVIAMQQEPWRLAMAGVAWAYLTPPGSPPAEPLEPAVWNPWRITQFANSYQFLDQPSEWYYDQIGKHLYLVLDPGQDANQLSIQLPVSESLLSVAGTAQAPVRNLSFKNLEFNGSTWLDPSFGQGYIPDQAGIQSDGGLNPVTGDYLNGLTTIGHTKFTRPTPAAVSIGYAKNVSLIGNQFSDLGGVALQLARGSKKTIVENNHFSNISSNAIVVGGVEWCRVDPSLSGDELKSSWVLDPASRITAYGTDAFPSSKLERVEANQIRSNSIDGTGLDYPDASAILVGFAGDTQIIDNLISDSAWSGVQVGWGWGLLDTPRFTGVPSADVDTWLPRELGVATALEGTLIKGNEIRGWGQQVYDTGAIYTSGSQAGRPSRGTVIQQNLLHSKRPLAGSNVIYTDGGTRWVTVDHNLQYNNPLGVWWMGADFSVLDPVNAEISSNDPYFGFPFLQNDQPFGSEIGGAITRGDIRYKANIWENRWGGYIDPLTGAQFPFPMPAVAGFKPSPRYKNLSGWPNDGRPLFFHPSTKYYYDLTKNLEFAGNKFVVYDPVGANPGIDAWKARYGYGARWRPGASS